MVARGSHDRRIVAVLRPISAASSGETSVNSSGCSSARWDSVRRHAAGGVVLGQPVGGQHVGEAGIAGRSSVGIVRPLFLIERTGLVC